MLQAKDVELAVTVPLPKEGPVHDVKWTPAGDYFVVVAGGGFWSEACGGVSSGIKVYFAPAYVAEVDHPGPDDACTCVTCCGMHPLDRHWDLSTMAV